MKCATPAAKVVKDKTAPLASVEKQNAGSGSGSSSKKLKQAVLPFKTITPLPSKNITANNATDAKDTKAEQLRKRKLSYGSENDDETAQKEKKGKQKIAKNAAAASASTPAAIAASSNRKRHCDLEEETIYIPDDDEPLADEDDDDELPTTTTKKVADKTQQQAAPTAAKNKTSKATPQSAGKQSAGKKDAAAATKIQIKLPLPKRSRRKSLKKTTAAIAENTNVQLQDNNASAVLSESSDDIEFVAELLNPQKRPKLADDEEQKDNAKQVNGEDVEKIINPEIENKENTEPTEETSKIIEITENKTDVAETIVLLSSQNDAESIANEDKVDEENSTKLAQKTDIKQNETKADDNATIDIIDIASSENASEEIALKILEKSVNLTKTIVDSIIESSNSKSCQDNTSISITDEESTNISYSTCSTCCTNSKTSIETIKSAKPTNETIAILSSESVANEKQKQQSTDDSASSSDVSSASSTDENDDTTEHREAAADTDKSFCKNAVNDSLSTPKGDGDGNAKKKQTPKQLLLMERRRKAREEKERKLHEEKLQKQREKEQRELERKREREQKEEQRRKEREAKEDEKRKEREEKERKRLAEIEAKNEERRKRNEVKEEELRKKDEERKRKEQEKEEAEQKKKKAAEAFTKFFVPKKKDAKMADVEVTAISNGQSEQSCDSCDQLAFRPFQVKGGMNLAPITRKTLNATEHKALDVLMGYKAVDDNDEEEDELFRKKPANRTQLYLAELRSGKIQPHKWQRNLNDVKTNDIDDDDDDVQIIDELDQVAENIVEETLQPVERYRAKFFLFEENRRPPYRGTWRKKSAFIGPRKPFAQDKKHFDYEVDSDLEWEEEEPGESLHGSDDEKDKDEEDDDYDIDNEWFVPHGHLSDEELQNAEELNELGEGESNNREAQQVKLKLMQQEFAQEMKKETKKLKPRLIGCVWLDENGNKPDACPNVIWNILSKGSVDSNGPPPLEDAALPEKTESNSPNSCATDKTNDKIKPIVLSHDMLRNLVRLVHGNMHSKAFLISEFIAFIEANEECIKTGTARAPNKSTVREKIDEFAEWQVNELKDLMVEASAMKKKKKPKKYLCWVVNDEILKQMDLVDLTLKNAWQYTLQPKFNNANDNGDEEQKQKTEEQQQEQELIQINKEEPAKTEDAMLAKKKKKTHMPITKFTKKLSEEEKSQQLKNLPKAGTELKVPSNATSTTVKKRVQLITLARNLTRNETVTTSITPTATVTPMDIDEVIQLD